MSAGTGRLLCLSAATDGGGGGWELAAAPGRSRREGFDAPCDVWRQKKAAKKIDVRLKFDFFKSNVSETLRDGFLFSLPIPF